MDNIEAQNEEIEALQSIFGEECVSVIEECVIEDRVVIIRLAERSRLRATLSKAYPEEKPPEVVLIGSRHLEEQNDRVKSKVRSSIMFQLFHSNYNEHRYKSFGQRRMM